MQNYNAIDGLLLGLDIRPAMCSSNIFGAGLVWLNRLSHWFSFWGARPESHVVSQGPSFLSTKGSLSLADFLGMHAMILLGSCGIAGAKKIWLQVSFLQLACQTLSRLVKLLWVGNGNIPITANVNMSLLSSNLIRFLKRNWKVRTFMHAVTFPIFFVITFCRDLSEKLVRFIDAIFAEKLLSSDARCKFVIF